jgi:hypothetical protein
MIDRLSQSYVQSMTVQNYRVTGVKKFFFKGPLYISIDYIYHHSLYILIIINLTSFANKT